MVYQHTQLINLLKWQITMIHPCMFGLDMTLLLVQQVEDTTYGDAFLHDVLHILHLTSNLFLVSKGLAISYYDEVVKLIDNLSL